MILHCIRNHKFCRCLAVLLSIMLVTGLVSYTAPSAYAKAQIKVVMGNKNVTKKTYKMKKGINRMISVTLKNIPGEIKSMKTKSANKKIATVTKNHMVHAKKVGQTKVHITITVKKGKKTKKYKSWVRIKVVKNSTAKLTATPKPTSTPTYKPTGSAVMSASLIAGGYSFPLSIIDNEAGRQFYDNLPVTFLARDLDGADKLGEDTDGYVYTEQESNPGTLEKGDLMLWGTSQYLLTYKNHASGYYYTRLGKVLNTTNLELALGSGAVPITVVKSDLPMTTYTPVQTVQPTIAPTLSPTTTPTVTPVFTPTVTPVATAPVVTSQVTPTPSAGAASGSAATTEGSATISPTVSPTASATPYTPVISGDTRTVRMIISNYEFFIELANTEAASRFYESLPRNLPMSDLGGDRKYCMISETYPIQYENPIPRRFNIGDLKLLDGNCLEFFYKGVLNPKGQPENSEYYNSTYPQYTAIGALVIESTSDAGTTSQLKAALQAAAAYGDGSVMIQFEKYS